MSNTHIAKKVLTMCKHNSIANNQIGLQFSVIFYLMTSEARDKIY